jgi:DNA-directed RNA polymerase specialized sigma24 family protein
VAANIKFQKHQQNKLLRSIRSGDYDHFTLVYETYSPALFGCILERVHDEATASVLLQQVFVEAWRRCKEQDCAHKSLFAWLYSITRELSEKYLHGIRCTEQEPTCPMATANG